MNEHEQIKYKHFDSWLDKDIRYILRLAEPKDSEEILKLYRSIIGTPGCTWSEEYPVMDNIISDIASGSLYCMTDISGQIIAAAAAGPLDELSDLEWDPGMTKPCELARIGVSPSLQKKGIASKLLCAVIEDCKSRGYNGMRFLVSKTNGSALALYNKFGFMKTGEVFRYGHDFLCYYKLLNQGDLV